MDDSYFTVKSDKGGHAQHIGLNRDGSIRLYAKDGNGNTLSVSMVGGSITSIALDIKASVDFTVKAINGTDTVPVEAVEGKFAINAKEFAIQNVSKLTQNSQLQLNKITIDYTLDGSVLAKPVITPDVAVFDGELEVTIKAAEGASIFYTLDESDPTIESTAYAAPFKINVATTVKAIATKDEQVSGIAVRKYATLDTVSVTKARQLVADKNETPHYVRGVVASVFDPNSKNGFNGKIAIWMTDEVNAKDSLEAYQIYADSEQKTWESLVAAKDILGVGDTILVYAPKLMLYNNKVYETDGGYYVETLGKYKEDPTIKYDTLTVEQAIAAAEALADNATSETKYYIEGFTNHVQNYDALKGNQIFFMYDEDKIVPQDSVFEAYLAAPKKDGKAYPVLEGDKVRAFGFLKKYIDSKNNNAKILEVVEPTVEFISEVEGDRTIKIPELDTVTVAEALEIGKKLAADKPTDVQYVIKGYVSSIINYYDASTKKETFWMADTKESKAASNADGAFEVYGGVPNTEKEIGLHAYVCVTAKIQNYKGNTIETSGAAAVNVIEQGEVDIPQVVTVAQALEIGAGTTGTTEGRYEITGYVSSISEVYSSYGNETFWITDTKGDRTSDKTKAFYVYRGKPNTGKEIGMDAKIKIICKIKNFNGTIENDGTNVPFEVLEQGTDLKLDTVTVTEALAVGNALADNAYTDMPYVVKGYVTKAYDPAEGKSQQNFYMADDPDEKGEFYAYSGTPDKKINDGDYILLTGKIQKYVKDATTAPKIEISNGSVVHLEIPKVDTLSVAQALEIGQALEPDAVSARYYVLGYVAEITDPFEEDLQSFKMSDDETAVSGEFLAQDALIADPGAIVHDKVLLVGKITKESSTGTIMMKNAKATVNPGEGIKNIVVTEKARKIVVDGVIYIVRDNKIFNLQGAQVR